MSTANAVADVHTGHEVVLLERTPSELTEPQFTAAQIESDCPVRLQDLAKRITEGIEKVSEQKKLAKDQEIAVEKLIAEVKVLCDVGGFAAFREKFFPNLRKSRAYELLAIGTNKKSVHDIKAGTRARVAKHRANKAASVSVTVTGNADPEALGAPTEAGTVETTSIAPEQMSEPTKPPSSVSPGDEALIGFSSAVCRLVQITRNKKAERYAKTSVSADELARLGKFLTDIANLKVPEADLPVPPANGTVSAEQSAEDIKGERPAQDAEELRQ